MDVSKEFESRLFDWGIGVAGRWIEEWCFGRCWDQESRAYLAFAHALDKRPEAMKEANEVLGVAPFNEWALAALFLLVEPLGGEYEKRFISEQGSRLGSHWIRTFSAIGQQDKAEEIYIINLLDGNPRQIADICFNFDDFKLTPDPERENMSVEDMIKEAEEEL